MGSEFGQSSHRHAYATADEETAWRFARDARENLGDDAGRARVYAVSQDASKVRPGWWNSKHPTWTEDEEDPRNNDDLRYGTREDLHEYVAPRFKVTGRLDIMPGRQGTFPEENWNDYKAKQAPYSFDANHGTERDMERANAYTEDGNAYQRGGIAEAERVGKERMRKAAETTHPALRKFLPEYKKPEEIPGQASIPGMGEWELKDK
jgi:hypothetical protein